MSIKAETWLTILMISLVCAAGCSDSQAPAMTQAVASRKPVVQTDAPATDSATHSTPAAGATVPASSSADIQESATAGAADKPQTEPTEPAGASNRLRDISFDDLKFDMNKGDPFERSRLTDKIEALDGKRIRLRGYILPSFQQTGLTQFVLVRDNLSCCFGPGAAIYDCVIVEMKPGHSTDYSLYPVAVDGTFTIREMLDPDGKAVAIYHLDGEQVR